MSKDFEEEEVRLASFGPAYDTCVQGETVKYYKNGEHRVEITFGNDTGAGALKVHASMYRKLQDMLKCGLTVYELGWLTLGWKLKEYNETGLPPENEQPFRDD